MSNSIPYMECCANFYEAGLKNLEKRGLVRLKGRVAIVTGGARGLGKDYALRLSEEGARIVVADILDAADIATALFLASDDSDFITGQTIVVDGGAVFH